MKKNIDFGKHQKEAIESRQKIYEKQIFMNDLRNELKKEIVSEGLILLAISIFFMDCDL